MGIVVKAIKAAGSLRDLYKIVKRSNDDDSDGGVDYTLQEIDQIVTAFGDLIDDVMDVADVPMTVRKQMGHKIRAIGQRLSDSGS